MKSYPSISTKMQAKSVIAFDKLDGSNIRAEWSNKKGFYKFGSRTRLIDRGTYVLGESIDLILENYADQLAAKFEQKKWTRVVAFFEFLGDSSFAGWHANEEHQVTLIDVDVYKRGIIEPDEFVDNFGDLGIPNVVHNGMLSRDLITDVKNGTLDGMTYEGIVCKYKNQKNKKTEMFKVKSRQWLNDLTDKCNGNAALYSRLK